MSRPRFCRAPSRSSHTLPRLRRRQHAIDHAGSHGPALRVERKAQDRTPSGRECCLPGPDGVLPHRAARPARGQCGPGCGRVAGSLRRVRSAAAVRDRHGPVPVSAAQGGAEVRVRRVVTSSGATASARLSSPLQGLSVDGFGVRLALLAFGKCPLDAGQGRVLACAFPGGDDCSSHGQGGLMPRRAHHCHGAAAGGVCAWTPESRSLYCSTARPHCGCGRRNRNGMGGSGTP